MTWVKASNAVRTHARLPVVVQLFVALRQKPIPGMVIDVPGISPILLPFIYRRDLISRPTPTPPRQLNLLYRPSPLLFLPNRPLFLVKDFIPLNQALTNCRNTNTRPLLTSLQLNILVELLCYSSISFSRLLASNLNVVRSTDFPPQWQPTITLKSLIPPLVERVRGLLVVPAEIGDSYPHSMSLAL